MPTVLIPPSVPQFTPANGQVTGPADGDALLAASVNTLGFQPLADRSLLAFQGLYGVSGSRTVAKCTDGVHLVLNSQVVRSSSRVLSGSLGSPIDISAYNTADTWYYVYGFDNAGTMIPVISATAPDATLRYSSASADQMLITMFRTDGAGLPRLFIHTVQAYSYVGVVNLLSGGAAAVYTQVPIVNVPPFASQAIVAITGLSAAAGITYVDIVPHGLTSVTPYEMRMGGSSNPGVLPVQNNDSPLIPIIGQNGFDYRCPVASSQVNFDLLGFLY